MVNSSDIDASGVTISDMTMPVDILDEAWPEESVDAGTHKTLSRSSSRSSWMLLSRSSSGVDLGLERPDEKEEGGEGQQVRPR
jgi:hypothetical protein